ncbi:MAG: lysophospholipid acyltransferase family protein [Bacteroidetes bacterium]|nr:lysophospholipid acyltransferase family protein [Bacteroidota bacterium]
MQRLVFCLVYPFLYLIALLPFRAMYWLSDFAYYLFRISGYRREVVLTNLRNSFPEKNESEIKKLCNSYFRYLCDLILETLKTLTMTEREAKEHCIFHRADWLDKMYSEGKSIIIVLGHYGNWEWAGPSFTLANKHQLNVIYRPLSNPYFDNMMTRMRTKFGTRITPADQTLREMVSQRKKITATAFIADQAAITANPYWTTFLNQDTSVYTGPEKLAAKFNYPVVYMRITRKRRGYYDIVPELLFENPAATAEGEILEEFTRRLERQIVEDPVIWLWSHKRWKHKRPIQ